MKNRRKFQKFILISSSLLLLSHLIYSTEEGWRYWPLPLSMALLIIGQIHELRRRKEK